MIYSIHHVYFHSNQNHQRHTVTFISSKLRQKSHICVVNQKLLNQFNGPLISLDQIYSSYCAIVTYRLALLVLASVQHSPVDLSRVPLGQEGRLALGIQKLEDLIDKLWDVKMLELLRWRTSFVPLLWQTTNTLFWSILTYQSIPQNPSPIWTFSIIINDKLSNDTK